MGRLSGLAPEVASTMVRVAGDIALVIGRDGVIQSVADGGLPLAGSSSGWTGRAWADTVDTPTRPKIENLLQEARLHGVSRRRELNHPAADGGQIPMSWAAVQLGDHGPLLAVGRDLRAVSAIQQRFVDAQRELERDYWQRRSAESHYRLLFQVANDAVLVLDADTGNVLDANPAAGVLFGQPITGWTGMPVRTLLDASVHPMLDELLLTARTTGQATELRLRAADQGRPLDVSVTPFRAEGQQCLLLRARRADLSAADTPAVLDFIGQTPDAVVVTDTDGRVLWSNPAFVELCHAQDEARVRGQRIADVLGDPQRQWPALLARVRARGIVGRTTLQLHVAGAPAVEVDLSAAVLAEGDQEHIGFTLRAVAVPATRSAPARDEGLVLDVSALIAQVGHTALPDLLAEASQRLESHFIHAALQAAGGRLDFASAALRIGTDSLLLRMERLGIPLPNMDTDSRLVN